MVQKIFDRCCGCGACAAACPKNAIEMTADHRGFYKPKVLASCVGCGLCLKVCPVETPPAGKEPVGYYACTAEPERVLRSSSGGVFSLLAEEVLKKSGKVFGCGWSEKQLPRHKQVSNPAELAELYGSKYAQSDMNGVYPRVKAQLLQGQPVLFSGTPCQVAGLKRFLNKEYENLLTVDFICHGVPSAKVLRKHLDELEQKQGAKVKGMTFRDKAKDWQKLQMTVRFDDGTEYSRPAAQDPYYQAFLSNLSLNTICGSCPFNSLPRCADITLGDFWGVERHHAEFVQCAGVSCVVVSSEKGAALFEAIRPGLTLVSSSKEAIMDGNPFLNGHCTLHKRRDRFFAKLERQPLDTLTEKCLKLTKLEWAKEVLSYRLGKKKHG